MKKKIKDLFNNTKKTLADITDEIGIAAEEIRSLSGMTDTEIYARDTQIIMYDMLGYDVNDPRNLCERCGIILIHEGAGVPPKWGLHQSSVGNVCRSCHEDLVAKYKDEHEFLMTCSCAICHEDGAELFYYKSQRRPIHPNMSVPLCDKHTESAYEESFKRVVRHFHGGLPSGVIYSLHRRA